MRYRLSLLLIGILCMVPCCAQAIPHSLSLSEAVHTALLHNPEVAAADGDVRVACTKFAQVRAQQRLTIAAVGAFAYLKDQPTIAVPPVTLPLPAALGGPKTIELPNMPLANHDITVTALKAEFPLSTGGRVKHGLEEVQEGVTALEAQAQSQRREIELAVVRAYFGTLLAQHVAAVNDEATATVKEHVAQAESLFKSGLVPKYELIRAQTELANQERRQLDAHNQADLAMAFLEDTLGTPECDAPMLTTPLQADQSINISLDAAIATAENCSSDMQALRARDRLYLAAEKLARAEKNPTLAAVAVQELYVNDQPFTTPGAFVGLLANVPIVDGGMADAKAAEQVALRERNQSDIDRLCNGIRLEVRKYYLDISSAHQALEASDKAVELATENKRLAARRFAVGQGTSIEVTDAILALSLAETNREQARYQYELAYYGLEKAMGRINNDFVRTEDTRNEPGKKA